MKKSVDQITADSYACQCPHCAEVTYLGDSDPRGHDHRCEECGRTFHVPMGTPLVDYQ